MHDAVSNAIAGIEAGLAEDPRRERAGSEEGPRDLLFIRRVVSWVRRLTENPSDALLLACWGHVLFRWRLPRESLPMTTAGYHKWRAAQSRISAEETEKILVREKVPDEVRDRTRRLILKSDFPEDPEAQILEDADCLAFLELKFENYLDDWDETKTIRILKGTLEKMSPAARAAALAIPLPPRALALLEAALRTEVG